MQHIIKKQIINLELSNKADAFRLQQKVSEHFREDVLPMLETLFDEVSSKDEIIQIDLLEVDLGLLSEKEITGGHWDDTILSKIKDQLHKQIRDKEKEGNSKKEAEAYSICRQWLYYMKKGYLPWNTLQVNGEWYKKVLETLAVDFAAVNELRNMIVQYPTVTRRIVQQHDEDFLQQLVAILTTENQQQLPEVIRQLARLILRMKNAETSGKNQQEKEKKIWEKIIVFCARTEQKSGQLRLTTEVLRNHIKDKDLLEKILTADSNDLALILPVLNQAIQSKDIQPLKNSKKAIIENGAEAEQALNKLSGIDEEGLFVQNAGVVLLHPFLVSFFKRLQFVNEGKFENEYAQQKAMYLLHFLATGHSTAEEFELTVPKILCQWPLALPVNKNIELHQDELSEAENMLQAAIEQWDVLKSTSADGLREGFLQRRGKYSLKKEKKYLQVEGSSLDILLDKLPWNLNMIKLPWMEEILWVEWR